MNKINNSVNEFISTAFNVDGIIISEDDIDKIEDFIEDKYFLNYNYKLKIN